MLKVTIVCFVAVQFLLVQAKTYDEVVQDLEPISQSLHNTVALIEFSAHSSENAMRNYVRQYGNYARIDVVSKIRSTMKFIEDTTDAIIVDNGMTAHLDQIEHCLAKKDTDAGLLQHAATAGAEVCERLGNLNIGYAIETDLTPMFVKQRSVHASIIAVKEECRSSESAEQGLMCITNTLYGKWKPEVENLDAETKEAVAGVTIAQSYTIANVNMCNKLVLQIMDTNMNPITGNFRNCVVEVANSFIPIRN